MKFAACYMRVSTGQQSTRSQEPDLRRWADAQDEPVKWFVDRGVSGLTMDRENWNKLAQAIRQGKVSTICVWRIDRLGRTASGLTQLFDELKERNVNLVSLSDGINLATPTGTLIANLLASLGQWETEVRGLRVKSGQAAARAAGKRWGGSQAGVRKKVTPQIEKIIRDMHAREEPITVIARTLQISRPTIYDVLRCPAKTAG